jgi:hypothetical protein
MAGGGGGGGGGYGNTSDRRNRHDRGPTYTLTKLGAIAWLIAFLTIFGFIVAVFLVR